MKNLLFLDELRNSSKIFVACSGGIDSMVLLECLYREGLPVHALHCNFQLRGAASDADEEFVRDYCKQKNIPFTAERFETNALKKNSDQSIQQIARDLRYTWFETLLQLEPQALLCTAHHRDDHEEQVWLRVLASGRILDLGGILAQRDSIRRPLLNSTKQEILEYAQNHGITWREDSSNQTTDYTRNIIRHELKPLLNSIDKRHESAALRLAREVQKIRTEGDQILNRQFGEKRAKGEFFVSGDFWENQLFLVKELLLESWRGSNAQLHEIERFYHDAKIGSRLEFQEGFYILREKDGLWFGQHALDAFEALKIDWSRPHKTTHYEVQHIENDTDDRIHLCNPHDLLEIRKIDSGETMHFSDGKQRKLKKIFNDEKWPQHERMKALGWYLNEKLIGVINPQALNILELGEKSSGKMTKIIKFPK